MSTLVSLGQGTSLRVTAVPIARGPSLLSSPHLTDHLTRIPCVVALLLRLYYRDHLYRSGGWSIVTVLLGDPGPLGDISTPINQREPLCMYDAGLTRRGMFEKYCDLLALR